MQQLKRCYMEMSLVKPISEGVAPQGAVAVSVETLDDIDCDPASLTLRAGAGARISSIRDAAAQDGLVIPGLPLRVTTDRVGSAIARGEAPRRALCGIEAVLTSGDVIHTGGRVLKDVTAYDLASMLLGSMGTLAVITAATFRLEPTMAGAEVAEPRGVTNAGDGPDLKAAFDPLGLLGPAAA